MYTNNIIICETKRKLSQAKQKLFEKQTTGNHNT